jgi:hypothetical protein
VLAGTRGLPIILSNEAIIEALFVANTSPIPTPAYIVSRYYVLNLVTNVETAMPASFQPYDVWPH